MKQRIYSIFICILAIVSVVFAIWDIINSLPNNLVIVDYFIYFIFVGDYVIRLIFSENKKDFISKNILDLIAILPINSAFRIFRTFKIFRLARFAKIARLFAVLGRLNKKSKLFLNTNGFKYMLMLSVTLILICGALISHFENMTLLDGMWWAFVTATTVGYGDISPSTGIGRIIACILMISGIGLIGSLTSTLTSFFITPSNDTTSNEKVNMVLVLYEQLNETEKDLFYDTIHSSKMKL